MKIATWNVGGIASRNKIVSILRRIRELKVDVIILQEIFRTGDPDAVPDMDKKMARIKDYVIPDGALVVFDEADFASFDLFLSPVA